MTRLNDVLAIPADHMAVIERLGQGARSSVYLCKAGEDAFALKYLIQNSAENQRLLLGEYNLMKELRQMSLDAGNLEKLHALVPDARFDNDFTKLIPNAWAFEHTATAMYRMPVLKPIDVKMLSDDEFSALKTSLVAVMLLVHQRGLAYHDFSPRNVMRAPDGSFCVIDFEECVPLGAPLAYPGSARYTTCDDSTLESDRISVALVLAERYVRLPWDGLWVKAEIRACQAQHQLDGWSYFKATDHTVTTLLAQSENHGSCEPEKPCASQL